MSEELALNSEIYLRDYQFMFLLSASFGTPIFDYLSVIDYWLMKIVVTDKYTTVVLLTNFTECHSELFTTHTELLLKPTLDATVGSFFCIDTLNNNPYFTYSIGYQIHFL